MDQVKINGKMLILPKFMKLFYVHEHVAWFIPADGQSVVSDITTTTVQQRRLHTQMGPKLTE